MTRRLPTPEIPAPSAPGRGHRTRRCSWPWPPRCANFHAMKCSSKAALAASELSTHVGLLVYALRTYAEAADMPVLTAKCMLALRGDVVAIAEITRAVADLARSKP